MTNPTANNKTSHLVNSQVPFFVRNDHRTFVTFLEKYYEYLEQSSAALEGKAIERSKNLIDYFDIDKTLDDLSEHLYNTYLREYFPDDADIDKAMVLKNVKEFYRSKGSENSIRFLMRAIYNKEVEFYYPKQDILRASDGKWYIQKTVRVANTVVAGTSNNTLTGLQKFTATSITGNTSNATATVETVSRYLDGGIQVDELTLSAIVGSFENGETIRSNFVENGTVKLITSNVFGGIVTAVSIDSAGSRYQIGDPLVFTSTSGTGAVATVSKVTSGNIASITVLVGGAGYQNGNIVLISGGGGSGANGYANVESITQTYHPNTYNIVVSLISDEANTAIGNTSYGNLANIGATSDPANDVISNSLVTFVYSNTGPAATITVTAPGSGYISTPSLGIVANSRIQELGILGRLDINSGGSWYEIGDVIEFINITGGYGTGAIAQVSNVDVANSNTITAVQFTEMTGHLIGGSGYNANFLPTANIISANVSASNADITVNCLLGSGATLISANSTLGAIREISLSSGGSGYTEAPTIDMTGSGDGTANLTASFITGVKTYAGRYLNDDGFISSFNFLEDRDYYQNYSYVIRINEPIDKYRKAIKDLVHPAGMKLFGEYTYVSEFDSYALPITSDVTHASDASMIWLPKTYVKTGNTISVSYASHGLSNSANVFLEFTTGGANINVGNGVFVVSSNALTNSFEVIQYGPIESISINPSANGAQYNANSYLVFSNEDTGSGANGTFVANTVTGNITSINIASYGINYSSTPTVTANGTNSSAALFTVTIAYANSTSGSVNVGIYIT